MALKAYEEFAPEPLVFPIGSKRYEVPPLGYREGIRLQGILAGTDHSLDGKDPTEGWRLVLGTAWDEMVADDVPIEALSRAGFTAMTDFQFGRTAAENVWESGISPEALAAAMAATQTSQDSQPLPSTGSGNRTQRRASTRATTSPKNSKPKAKASQS